MSQFRNPTVPMIFGFNTDVKHGDTIYHVQSEAREGELLLQSQVFVRGRCIGKRATSYGSKAAEASFGDAQKEQQLREQHRLVLDAIREGKLDSVLDHPEAENLAAVKQMDLEWLNTDSILGNGKLTMQLRVTEGGASLPGAQLTSRFARPGANPVFNQAVTDAGGTAEIKIDIEESALQDSSLLVQATFQGRTTTRKFELRKAE